MRYIIFIPYFLSGFSALIYEVVWLRKLELVFGTTTHAVSTVLAVFFSGLAIGAWLFGRMVDSAKFKVQSSKLQFKVQNDPLFLYALLELGIGIYAVLTPWIFTGIEQIQAFMWQQFSFSNSGFSFVTFVLAALGLILPTILMGGTLPVVVKAVSLILTNEKRMRTNNISSNSYAVGLLYGLNTLGAVIGVLAAGFFLIPSIGVNQTIWLAAGISMLAGGIAVYFSRKFDYT